MMLRRDFFRSVIGISASTIPFSLGYPTIVWAQSPNIRLYLMPLIGAGTKDDSRRPKYEATHMAGLSWSMMDYGNEPIGLVGIKDISTATHLLLAAELDVLALPQDLDTQIGAQLATVQNAMESRSIPAGWVQGTFTYRQVIRIVAQAFAFMQRLQFITPNRLLTGAVNLDTRFNQLPVAMRNDLVSAANSLQYDTSSLSGTSTLRVILKTMADQWRQIELIIGGGPI